MKKRIISAICAAAMVLSAATVPISKRGVVFAPSISASADMYGDYQYFRHYDGTIMIYRYKGSDAEVVIPSELDGTVVTIIDKNAFKDNTAVKKVTLPENCTTIEENAFSGCTSLETVVVPPTLTHILSNSFYGCTSLKDIQLENVKVIWFSAFNGCSSLEEVTLNEELGALKESAFEGCSSLKSIVLPATLTTIEPYTFKGCTSLENVTITDGIKRLESGCFMGCTSLSSVFLPKSIRYIEPDAFIDCSSLVSIDGQSRGTYFYDSGLVYAFATKGYELYIFPEGSESLYSFKGYFEIPRFALRHCPKLKNIFLYTCNDNLSLNNGILYTNDCTELIRCPETKMVYSALTLPAECKKIRQYGMSRVKINSVILPDGMTELEDEAFLDSKALTTIVIPDSVTTFGENVFGGCDDLVIVCNEGSQAEQYAKDNDIKYQLVYSTTPHTHSYTMTVTEQPTCTETGVKTYTCDCGDTYLEPIPALGHDFSTEWTIDVEPTATTPGSKSHHCTRCEEKTDITDIPATGVSNPTVKYTPNVSSIDLSWNDVTGAEQYAICGYTNGKWRILAKTDGTFYTLNKLKAETEYKLAVIAMFGGEWNMDFSNAITATTKSSETPAYPTVTSIDYNEQYHQFRLNWTAVPNAQNYGIAVYLAGKWKIQKQNISATTTSFTSPKLTPGKTYKMLIAAKIDGKWDLSAMNSRAFAVTVK